MLSGKRISFVGAGNMAEALVKGLVASGKISPSDVVLSARRPERAQQVAQHYGARAATDNNSCVSGASVVVIAVKPQVLTQVVSSAAGSIPSDALVISVAAGVTTSLLESILRPGTRVIRSM